MAAVVRVQNGITRWDASQLNQYADLLNAVLGITDTAQSALGRLVVPQAAAAPSGAVEGQIYYDTVYHEMAYRDNSIWRYVPWHVGTVVPPAGIGRAYYRTDEGPQGKLHIRDVAGNEVPYLPIRQYVESAELGATVVIVNNAFTDVAGLTLSITTTGGRLFIGVRPSNTSGLDDYILAQGNNPSTGVTGGARVVVGAQNLGGHDFGFVGSGLAGLETQYVPMGGLTWIGYRPAAGTYTVKLQAYILGGGVATVSFHGNPAGGLALYCMEFGD